MNGVDSLTAWTDSQRHSRDREHLVALNLGSFRRYMAPLLLQTRKVGDTGVWIPACAGMTEIGGNDGLLGGELG